MMVIENKFNFSDIVYLITDKEQAERIVTGFSITPTGITYRLNCGAQESWHYEFEISKEKSILVT